MSIDNCNIIELARRDRRYYVPSKGNSKALIALIKGTEPHQYAIVDIMAQWGAALEYNAEGSNNAEDIGKELSDMLDGIYVVTCGFQGSDCDDVEFVVLSTRPVNFAEREAMAKYGVEAIVYEWSMADKKNNTPCLYCKQPFDHHEDSGFGEFKCLV